MILLILLGVSAISTVGSSTGVCSTCFLVNTTCYNSTYLFDLQAPFRNEVVIHKLGLLRSRNILFFSFEPIINDIEYYKIGFVNLDNPNMTGIISNNRILNFGAFDIDQDNNMIYLGGSDGIFILDMNNNKMSSFSSRGDEVTNVFYKNNLYFTMYAEDGVKVKIGDYFQKLIGDVSVKKFVVNKMGVIVYLNSTGLFASKGQAVTRLSANAFFRGIVIDLDDNVYAWWIDGLYRIIIEKDLDKSRIIKVAELPGIGALAFDNDNNMLVIHDMGLYRVSPTDGGCGTVTPIT